MTCTATPTNSLQWPKPVQWESLKGRPYYAIFNESHSQNLFSTNIPPMLFKHFYLFLTCSNVTRIRNLFCVFFLLLLLFSSTHHSRNNRLASFPWFGIMFPLHERSPFLEINYEIQMRIKCKINTLEVGNNLSQRTFSCSSVWYLNRIDDKIKIQRIYVNG